MNGFSGLAAIHKQAGMTSFAALGPIKRSLGTGKVGHAGTLDRFATGLLVVLTGRYSRLAPFFAALDKRYKAVVRFGTETDTLDPEGSIIAEAPPPSREAIEIALPLFRGAISQSPPVYSALHVDGKRAYERARSGEVVEMAQRPVTIYELILLDFDGRDAEISVSCSSGTYIRSLARDIALAASSRASLVSLERTAIGFIKLEEAVSPDDFEPERDLKQLTPGMASALGFRVRLLEDSALHSFQNGGNLDASSLIDMETTIPQGKLPIREQMLSAVFDREGLFQGLVRETGNRLEYRFVLGGGNC